jgi:hypothetical protein
VDKVPGDRQGLLSVIAYDPQQVLFPDGLEAEPPVHRFDLPNDAVVDEVISRNYSDGYTSQTRHGANPSQTLNAVERRETQVEYDG